METRSSSEIADGLMFARRTARRNSENDKDPLPFVSDNLKSPFQSSSSRNFVACVWEATDERRRQSAPTLCGTRAAAATHTRSHARTTESVLMRGLGAAHIAHTPSSGCTPFEFPIPCAASALIRKFLAARRFSPRVSCVRVHACACVRVASREVSAQSAQDWICTSMGRRRGREEGARHLVAGAAASAALLASSLDRGILRLLQAARRSDGLCRDGAMRQTMATMAAV
jgi:hypothetical protein